MPGYGEALTALQHSEDSESEKAKNAGSGTQEEVKEQQPVRGPPPQRLWEDRYYYMH